VNGQGLVDMCVEEIIITRSGSRDSLRVGASGLRHEAENCSGVRFALGLRQGSPS
jgi:hypothetical protein